MLWIARNRRRARYFVGFVAAAAFVVACTNDPTQIVVRVEVDSQLSQGPGGDIDAVRVSAGVPGGTLMSRTGALAAPEATGLHLPANLLAVTPRPGDVPASVLVRAEGLAQGTSVVEASVVTTFIAGSQRNVTLTLYHACLGVACASGQTCSPSGTCVAIPTTDAGVDAALDACGDCALSDVVEHETGTDTMDRADAPPPVCGDHICNGTENGCTCSSDCMCPTEANATSGCSGATCTYTCVTGFADCDSNPANGCESSLGSAAHCGSCGNACPASYVCSNGTCAGCGDGTCNNGETITSCPFDCDCVLDCCNGNPIHEPANTDADCDYWASASGGAACGSGGAYEWRHAGYCTVRATACPCCASSTCPPSSCPDHLYCSPPSTQTCSLSSSCCTSSSTCTVSSTCCL